MTPPAPRRWPTPVALGAYLLLVFAAAWPLTGDLSSRLPGDPSGDTGVYIWNLWVFRYELLNGSSPLWTSRILYPGPPIDLALHNFTVFQDALGLVLIPLAGIVGAFNLTWLLMQALSGLAVFLLARRYTARDGIAWLAGALFACSPTIIARSMAHQSLVAAAPLAFFAYFVLRAADRRSVMDAVLAGVCAAWAAVCDAYYGIYCVPLLACVGLARVLRWEPRPQVLARPRWAPLLTIVTLVPVFVIVLILVTGGRQVHVLGQAIRMRTLYTPVLALTVLVLLGALVASWRRGRWRVEIPIDRFVLVQLAAGACACALLLTPLLAAAWTRVRAGGALQEPVLWRSSPGGVDLLAFVIPNPNHPLAPDAFREFLTPRPDMYPEYVASIPLVALAVIVLAVRRAGPRAPIEFLAVAVVFGLLALGPFIMVGHANTHVPGPWALLRYVPILGAARSPARFAIPMLIGVAVVFAWALDRLALRHRRAVVLVGALLAFELLPVPRPTASGGVPAIYSTIAADPDDVSVLELPFAIRDGTTQVGSGSTATQFYQATHEKRLIGGYLSRIPRRRVQQLLQFPTLRLLARLSEPDGKVEPNLAEAAREDAPWFVQQARVRYVVIDTRLASEALRRTAIELLSLQPIQSDGPIELYRVR